MVFASVCTVKKESTAILNLTANFSRFFYFFNLELKKFKHNLFVSNFAYYPLNFTINLVKSGAISPLSAYFYRFLFCQFYLLSPFNL